jgi:hypothetical protein
MRIKLKVNLNDVPDPPDTLDVPLDNEDDMRAPQPDLIVVGETAVVDWYLGQGTDEIYKRLMKEGQNEV